MSQVENQPAPPTLPAINGVEDDEKTLEGMDALRFGLGGIRVIPDEVEDEQESKSTNDTTNSVTYGSYLHLDALLKAQTLRSVVHDEHLFIIVHQVYELWFKQVLYELDSVCDILNREYVDECNMLLVVTRMNRVVRILQLLVDQVMILETMTPLDFMEFRDGLGSSSGFQSLQFRLLENKLGIKTTDRVVYAGMNYKDTFSGEDRKQLHKSETEPTLLQLLEHWLCRTPGIEENGFNFFQRFAVAVNEWMNSLEAKANEQTDPKLKEEMLRERARKIEVFETIFKKETHEEMIEKGNRRLSHKAMQGALMIFFYRDIPRFSQPYLFLQLLMDMEALVTKWRYNHVILVQRMIGSKSGSGGSSGYQYLRSTISDRYKVFIDLFNLSTFLIPREYIPALTHSMVKRLSVGNFLY